MHLPRSIRNPWAAAIGIALLAAAATACDEEKKPDAPDAVATTAPAVPTIPPPVRMPEVTLTANTDYRLVTNQTVPGWPYTAVQITSFGSHTLPVLVTQGVQIIGTRGWSAIPAPIEAATLVQSTRLHARRNTPLGVAGSPEGGIVRLLSRLDPDVELMLRPYRVPREAL